MAQVTVRLAEGDLFVFPALDPGYEISAAVFAMKPRSRGRVSLHSNDPEAPLRIEHGFLVDARDAEVLAAGVDAVRSVAESEPLRRYAAREIRPGAEVSADQHVRSAARGFFHPVGTCAIGSVVDPLGRLLGAERVVVADASIIPELPRANTNLTTIAVAERIAEWL